jgi:lactate permease
MAPQVPVDLLHWILATLAIVSLPIFLVPLRWRALEAGPMAMSTAALVALLAFRTPWEATKSAQAARDGHNRSVQ